MNTILNTFYFSNSSYYISYKVKTEKDTILEFSIVSSNEVNQSPSIEKQSIDESIFDLILGNTFSSIPVRYAYLLAVEKSLKIEVPIYEELVRIILVEFNRISEHLYFFSTLGFHAGNFHLYRTALRDLYRIYQIFQLVEPNNFTDYLLPGGIKNDLPVGALESISALVRNFNSEIHYYDHELQSDLVLINRSSGVGVISPEMANKFHLTGPNLRASGTRMDLRKDKPYSIYNHFDFGVPIGDKVKRICGDSWSRCWVRLREIHESFKIINQAIHQLPQLRTPVELKPGIKIKDIIEPIPIEGPNGVLICTTPRQKTPYPYVLKFKRQQESFLNFLSEILPGCFYSDINIILTSLNLTPQETCEP